MPLFPPDPHARFRFPLPRFLVISPAKTGSTWLAENLRCHPQLFIPAIKEVKYFSTLFKWLDLDWYGAHFFAAPGQLAGEASPSYAALPLEAIRAIRTLMPEVKLVYLMRDPVERAWSHAKHMHRYREADFADCSTAAAAMTEAEWSAAFAADWPRAGGDYLGHLRRWRTVFPPEQLFVGFFESIIDRPAELLRDIFAFLGVDPDVDLARFPIRERILPGPEGELPPQLEESLRKMLGRRTAELTAYLRQEFGLTPPAAWQRNRPEEPRAFSPPSPDFTEADLVRIAAMEETFRTAYRQLQLNFRGHDLVFYRGRLLAIPHTLAIAHPETIDGPVLEQFIADGAIPAASTLGELKEWVTNRVLDQTEHCRGVAEAALREELQAARQEIARLQHQLDALTAEVRRPPPPPLWKRTLRGVRRRIVRH